MCGGEGVGFRAFSGLFIAVQRSIEPRCGLGLVVSGRCKLLHSGADFLMGELMGFMMGCWMGGKCPGKQMN